MDGSRAVIFHRKLWFLIGKECYELGLALFLSYLNLFFFLPFYLRGFGLGSYGVNKSKWRSAPSHSSFLHVRNEKKKPFYPPTVVRFLLPLLQKKIFKISAF